MHPADVAMPMTNQEFNVKVDNERAQLAALGEAITVADLYRRGYSVSRPLDTGRKYDLLVDRHGDVSRLIVLVALPSELSVKIARVAFRVDEFGPTEVHEPRYSGSEFEHLAIVDRASLSVYYVPSDEIDYSKTKFWIAGTDRLKYATF